MKWYLPEFVMLITISEPWHYWTSRKKFKNNVTVKNKSITLLKCSHEPNVFLLAAQTVYLVKYGRGHWQYFWLFSRYILCLVVCRDIVEIVSWTKSSNKQLQIAVRHNTAYCNIYSRPGDINVQHHAARGVSVTPE